MAIFTHNISIFGSVICVSYNRSREAGCLQHLALILRLRKRKFHDTGLSDSGKFVLVGQSKDQSASRDYGISA